MKNELELSMNEAAHIILSITEWVLLTLPLISIFLGILFFTWVGLMWAKAYYKIQNEYHYTFQ